LAHHRSKPSFPLVTTVRWGMEKHNEDSKPKVYYIQVLAEWAGQRIDNFLLARLKGVPKTFIYRILRKGEVRVNKGRIQPSYRVAEGDQIRIPPVRQSEVQPTGAHAAKTGYSLKEKIIYEDDQLCILNKPSGLAVHGGSGLSFGVIEALRAMYQIESPYADLELVHRLDRETSGCLVIAKRRSALRLMHEKLREGALEKIYWALVRGRWEGPSQVDAPLLKNQLQSGERMVKVHEEGQASLTEFRVLQYFDNCTLVEARPITGRTHQIRVHAAYAGHPIAGDTKYGDEEFNKMIKATVGLDRIFLHAYELRFQSLKGMGMLEVQAPLDEKLTDTLQQLREDHV